MKEEKHLPEVDETKVRYEVEGVHDIPPWLVISFWVVVFVAIICWILL